MNRSCKYFSRITRHKFWWIILKSSANFSWCVYYFNMFKQRKETFGVYSRFYLVKQDWTEIGLHDNKRKIIKTVYLFVFYLLPKPIYQSFYKNGCCILILQFLRTKTNSVLYLQLTQNHIDYFFFCFIFFVNMYSCLFKWNNKKKLLSNKWLAYISLKTFYEIIIMIVIKLIFIKHEAERLITAVGVFILLLW